MHIAFNGGKDNLAGFGRTGRCFLRFDGRLKDGDGFLHRACRFHDLRQEHFSRTEQFADAVHPVHQRPVDNGNGLSVPLQSFFQVCFKEIADPFQQRVFESFVERPVAPCVMCLFLLAGGLLDMTLCIGNQFFGRLGTTCQDHIFEEVPERWFNIFIRDRCRRVHDPHIHTFANGVIEKDGVHGFAHIVVSAE